MNITFTKDCPPIPASGNSAYTAGDKATLRRGAELIDAGVARDGWGKFEPPEGFPDAPHPAPQPLGSYIVNPAPDLSPTRKVIASKAVRKLADDNNLLIYSVVGTGKNGRVTKADVEALIA